MCPALAVLILAAPVWSILDWTGFALTLLTAFIEAQT
jgi:hypothetical protein